MYTRQNSGWLDRFRIVAALLVVAIHTSPLAGFSEGADFFLTRDLARIAVPFFLMVTGQFVAAGFLEPTPKTAARLHKFLQKTAFLYVFCILLYLPIGLYAGHYGKMTVFSAFRMVVFDGTFYHLWYFPACILGILLVHLMSRFLSLRWMTVVSAVLYVIGLFGDSYYGLARKVPVLETIYDAFFKLFSYTRNGLFLAPLFLVLGMWMAVRVERGTVDSIPPLLCAGGLAASFAAMTAEAFTLRHFALQRHDSMYFCLIPVMFFLYQCLLYPQAGPQKGLRTAAAWIYILHPAFIVVVRGIARPLHLTEVLVENNLVHYIAVALLSTAAGLVMIYIQGRKRPALLSRFPDSRSRLREGAESDMPEDDGQEDQEVSNMQDTKRLDDYGDWDREYSYGEAEAASYEGAEAAKMTEADSPYDLTDEPDMDTPDDYNYDMTDVSGAGLSDDSPYDREDALGADFSSDSPYDREDASDADFSGDSPYDMNYAPDTDLSDGSPYDREDAPDADFSGDSPYDMNHASDTDLSDDSPYDREDAPGADFSGDSPYDREDVSGADFSGDSPHEPTDIAAADASLESAPANSQTDETDASMTKEFVLPHTQTVADTSDTGRDGDVDDYILKIMSGKPPRRQQTAVAQERISAPRKAAHRRRSEAAPADSSPRNENGFADQQYAGDAESGSGNWQAESFSDNADCQYGQEMTPSAETSLELPSENARSRAWIELDADALKQNVELFRARIPERCRLMPAVKADAYGHGLIPISRLLCDMGVDAFCVACISEGIAMRKAGISGKILILGYTSPEDFPLLLRYRLLQTVVDYPYAEELNRFGRKLHVHIGIDTGMHRVGIRCENIEEITAVYQMENLVVDGLFTHLCVSDSPHPEHKSFTSGQLRAFYQVVRILKDEGYPCPGLHILASYGILNLLQDRTSNRQVKLPSAGRAGLDADQLAADYVRPGIALYGVLSTQTDQNVWKNSLKPVLSLKARVTSVRPLHAGESVSYGITYTAVQEMKIAAVAIGYADGLPRELSGGRGSVLINGRRAPILGRICMDQCIVDVSRIPDVKSGDTAVIIGRSGREEITAAQIAETCGTISHEILTGLAARLGRIVTES